jgi:hypothetical protein
MTTILNGSDEPNIPRSLTYFADKIRARMAIIFPAKLEARCLIMRTEQLWFDIKDERVGKNMAFHVEPLALVWIVGKLMRTHSSDHPRILDKWLRTIITGALNHALVLDTNGEPHLMVEETKIGTETKEFPEGTGHPNGLGLGGREGETGDVAVESLDDAPGARGDALRDGGADAGAGDGRDAPDSTS